MMKLFAFILAVAIAATSIGCGGSNNIANGVPTPPADPNKPTADPSAEAMLDMDRGMTEAFFKGDAQFFDTMLLDHFVAFDGGQRIGKADMLKMVGGMKCNIKSWSLTEPTSVKLDADNIALIYKSTVDGECTQGGKKTKVPSPTRAVSIWSRVEMVWRGVFHSETPIMGAAAIASTDADSKAASTPAKPADSSTASKDTGTRGDSSARSGNPAANKQAESKPAPPPPAKSPNSDALVAKHSAGWEAFKTRNAAWFNENLTTTAALIDPMGTFVNGRDNLVRLWTETMKCEGVNTVSFADGYASSLSPMVELLTGKGTADGKCDGQPNGSLNQAAVYVKEGDNWKLAFMTEAPAK